MRTPIQAIVWELWRTSRFELLFRMAAQSAFVLVLYFVAKDFGEPEMQAIRGVAVVLLAITSIFASTWLNAIDNSASGFSFRQGFTRPIATIQLVAVPMCFTVLAVILCYSLPALLFTLMMNANFPIVGPAIIVACCAACCVAVVWSATTRPGKVIGLMVLIIAVSALLFRFHKMHENAGPILFAIGKPEFFNFTWLHYVLSLVVFALAFYVTVISVDRQRHGEEWRPASLFFSRRFLVGSTRAQHSLFHSKVAAQCWYEWRRFGVPVLSLGFCAPLFLLMCLSIDPDWENSSTVWLGALALCPFAYQLVGADGAIGLRYKQGVAQLPIFDATRSMTNANLIAIKLLVIAACSILGWFFMALAAGVHTLAVGNWSQWTRVANVIAVVARDMPFYWWLVAVSNGVFFFISSSSVLLAFALWLPLYPQRFAAVFVLVAGHMCLAAWDASNEWALGPLWYAYGCIMPAVIVAACIAVLRRALSSGFLSKQLSLLIFVLWSIYATSTIAICIKTLPTIPIDIPTTVLLLGLSLIFVPLATTTIAPLAFASHRHA